MKRPSAKKSATKKSPGKKSTKKSAVKKLPKKSAVKKSLRMRVVDSTPKLQRMFKRIFNQLCDRGNDPKEAGTIAAATVNQYRRRHGLLVSDVGRGRWYPGKPEVKGRVAKAEQLLAEGDVQRADALLLQAIDRELPTTISRRYAVLINRRDTKKLTPKEHRELLSLTNKVETFEANRVQALADLAALRGKPLSSIVRLVGATIRKQGKGRKTRWK